MPFQPGNKLGKGRPKGSTRPEICRQFAEEQGFDRLISLAKGFTADGKKAGWAAPDPKKPERLIWVGPSEELQFEALKLAIAYGAGKPTESHEVAVTGRLVIVRPR